MKKILTVGIISLILTSCMTAKKYSTFVETATNNGSKQSRVFEDWIVIKSDKVKPTKIRCDQKKNSFVPAILYWGWNSTIECELDIETRIGFLEQGIYKAADSLNLKERLAGKNLEIIINEVPGNFLYENKGNAIIFVIAYTVSGVEAISPYPINLEFEYNINQEGIKVLEGNGYVQNAEQPLRNIWKSTKKFTWLYLEEFKKETERMGKDMVMGILEEMKMNN